MARRIDGRITEIRAFRSGAMLAYLSTGERVTFAPAMVLLHTPAEGKTIRGKGYSRTSKRLVEYYAITPKWECVDANCVDANCVEELT